MNPQLDRAGGHQYLHSMGALEQSVSYSLGSVSTHFSLLLDASAALCVRRYKVSPLPRFRSLRLAGTTRHSCFLLLLEDKSYTKRAYVCLPTQFQNAEARVLDLVHLGHNVLQCLLSDIGSRGYLSRSPQTRPAQKSMWYSIIVHSRPSTSNWSWCSAGGRQHQPPNPAEMLACSLTMQASG